MKGFIADRVLFPIAITSFCIAASCGVVGITALIPKATIQISRLIATKEKVLDEVIEYSGIIGASAFIGGVGFTALSSLFGGFEDTEVNAIFGESERFDYWAEIEKHREQILKRKCAGCRFYNDNDFLPCAINPELKYNCLDFDSIVKD